MSRNKTTRRRQVPDLGHRLAELRHRQGLTLKELQRLTGIPASTLSKVQNQQATLSFEHLVSLAQGLNVEVSDLFVEKAVDIKAGRRAVTRRGEGLKEATDRYEFELLCGDLYRKAMNPGIMEVSARTLEEAGGLSRHKGEEFIYVLSGEVEIHSEDYRPIRLNQGDALYLDSTSGHAYVAVGKGPACLLAVTTHMSEELAHMDAHSGS